MTVLQVCAYSSEYAGNFISSLVCLEELLRKKGIKTIYAFSEDAATRAWCKEIQERTEVFFLPEAKARILPETYLIFKTIYHKHDIAIVHTHFELYDIPATVTAKKTTKVFWHLHDPITIKKNAHGLLWRFQYGIVGKKAELISVSDYYRRRVVSVGFPEDQTRVVINGIDTDRIQPANEDEKRFDFLTFGWDYYRKGDDLILRACEMLAAEGFHFRLLLNGNDRTWEHLPEKYFSNSPDWLVKGEPVEDVNVLFHASRCFIQASRRETFSYGVCEAAYSGLPVICSDIPGVEWAADLPAVTFFHSEDINDLFQQMKEFLEEKGMGSVSSETQRIIEERYSIKTWANTIYELYDCHD